MVGDKLILVPSQKNIDELENDTVHCPLAFSEKIDETTYKANKDNNFRQLFGDSMFFIKEDKFTKSENVISNK
jgi:hypothetical protein